MMLAIKAYSTVNTVVVQKLKKITTPNARPVNGPANFEQKCRTSIELFEPKLDIRVMLPLFETGSPEPNS